MLASTAPGLIRDIIAERAPEIIHSQGYRSNLVSRAAMLAAGRRTKAVCTVHGAYHFASAPLRSKVYYALDYSTMFLSDRVIAVSAGTQQRIKRWARDERVVVVHNGTVIPPIPSGRGRLGERRALGIPESAKVVCFVGRLSPQKGVALLIDVAKSIMRARDDVVFLIVGDGELGPQVDVCAREFAGRMMHVEAQQDVRPFYVVSDVLFLPSRSEGLPFALIEAFAFGLPAVGSKVGGVPEVLVDGYNGFLCQGDDGDMMKERICRVLGDDDLRHRLAVNARETIKGGFSLSTMVGATYQVYSALVPRESHV